jgi:uncharacterized protein YecT (DUF1311 family)
MNRNYLANVVLAASFLISFSTIRAADEKTEVLFTSPSGAFRIERSGEPSSNGEEPTGDLLVVPVKDPTQRAKLPKQAADSPLDDELHFAPNEEWIFGLRHVGSGLRYGNVYHRVNLSQIEVLDQDESFNDLVWENCVKLGALKADYSAAGVYAMTSFVGWSLDSSRLLIELRGGEEKRSMQGGYLYFNTRTKKFEITDYLRKVKKAKSEALICAEPVDALPSETELKTRLDTLDQQLNKKYAEVIAQVDKDRVPLMRESQRNWLKHRDEGAKFYPALFSSAEKERRRLQFLGDVTAARIDTPLERWDF